MASKLLIDKDIVNFSHLLKLHCENRYQLAMNIFLLILFVFSIASTSFACTWTRGNSCYNLVETEFSFWEGETYCSVMFNGHLLTINSMQEDDFIRARLMDFHKPYGGEEIRKYIHLIKINTI